jgi:hypothetical protein
MFLFISDPTGVIKRNRPGVTRGFYKDFGEMQQYTCMGSHEFSPFPIHMVPYTIATNDIWNIGTVQPRNYVFVAQRNQMRRTKKNYILQRVLEYQHEVNELVQLIYSRFEVYILNTPKPITWSSVGREECSLTHHYEKFYNKVGEETPPNNPVPFRSSVA